MRRDLICIYQNPKFKVYLYRCWVFKFYSYYRCEIVRRGQNDKKIQYKKFLITDTRDFIDNWVKEKIGKYKIIEEAR